MANGKWRIASQGFYRPLVIRCSPLHLHLERAGNVPRPAPRRDEDGVGAQAAAHCPGIARYPGAGGAGEALALSRADRLRGDVRLRPRLDLDEGDGAAARHDEVDLAADRRIAPGE